jgi:Fe-S cluster assembly iron-binding protein IscA
VSKFVDGKGGDSNVIILTEAAKRRFLEIKPSSDPNGEVLRLDRVEATTNGDEPKLAVYVGEPEEGDDPVVHEGESLLHVSRMVSAAFDGCVVDLTETPEGLGFAIGPPRPAEKPAPKGAIRPWRTRYDLRRS